MNFLNDWFLRFGILFVCWPIVVMLAFFGWNSFRADSIRGLLRGLGITVTFGLMAMIGWLIGAAILVGIVLALAGRIGVTQDDARPVGAGVLVLVMALGAVLGWRYLAKAVGCDPKRWTI